MAPKPKLTPELRAQIRAAKIANPEMSNVELAEQFEIGRTSIALALAAEPEPAKPAAALASSIIDVPFELLSPSPDNPRKTFVDEDIAELAESIATSGLLQNLVVKAPKENGYISIQGADGNRHPDFYEIIAGERRYRALKLLAAQGRWDKTVPCLVIDADPGTYRALSLLENLQRQEILPLEEADGFAELTKLDPAFWTTQEIATRIGRSQRYVQQRIAIAANLVEPARVLLSHGFMTIEGARLMAAEAKAIQMEILYECDVHEVSEELLLGADCENVTVEKIRSALHFFGQRITAEKQAAARQAAPPPEPQMRLNNAGAASERDDTGKLSKETVSAPKTPDKPEPAGPPVTKAHIYHSHKRKSHALQFAVSQDTTMAMRLVCLALLGTQSVVMIKAQSFFGDAILEDDPGPLISIEHVIKEALDGVKPPYHFGDTKAELKTWARLMKLSGPHLDRLFAAVIARKVVTPAGHKCLLGDSPLADAIAEALDIPGNEFSHGLNLIEGDLTGLRKPLLLYVADETGTPGVNDATKTADLIEAIAKKRKDKKFVLPTLKFGSTKKIETELERAVAAAK